MIAKRRASMLARERIGGDRAIVTTSHIVTIRHILTMRHIVTIGRIVTMRGNWTKDDTKERKPSMAWLERP